MAASDITCEHSFSSQDKQRRTHRALTDLLRRGSGIVLIIVSVALLVSPDLAFYGGSGESGRLGGQVYHPHSLAICCVVMLGFYFRRMATLSGFCAIALAGLFLILTKSRTDIAAVLFSLISYVGLVKIRGIIPRAAFLSLVLLTLIDILFFFKLPLELL